MNIQYIQPGYSDLGEEAARIQVSHRHQRQRLLGVFRGYLRETTSPRWSLAILLAEALFASAILCWIADHCGFHHPGALAMLLFVAAWPAFLFLLYRRAARESQRLHLDQNFEHFIRLDETAQALETAPASEASRRRMQKIHNSVSQQSNQPGLDPIGLHVILILALTTAGIWLIYDLIRTGPQLIAQMLLDAHYLPAHPTLYRRVESGPWIREVGSSTAVHFLGLAIISTIIVTDVNLLAEALRPKPIPQMPAERPVGAVWRLGAAHAAPGRAASRSAVFTPIAFSGHLPGQTIPDAAPARPAHI